MVFYNEIVILKQLSNPGKAFLKFASHMVEIDFYLKLGLDKQQEVSQKLLHISSNPFSSILPMNLGQVDTDISLISLFIHSFSDEGNLLDELPDLVVKFFYVF
jgi:hypothetical protein